MPTSKLESVVEFDNTRLYGSLFNNQEILAIYIDSLAIAINEGSDPEGITKVSDAIMRILQVMMEVTSILGSCESQAAEQALNVTKAPDMVGCEPALGRTGCVEDPSPGLPQHPGIVPGIACGWNPAWNSEFDVDGGRTDVFDSVNDPRDVSLPPHCTCDYPDDRQMDGHAEHCDYAFKG
jgi:hypothetical protein